MWDTILGHEANKIFLGNMLQGERKTPALLFYGPDGIGKKKLAYEFARSFLCLDDPTHDDCKCRSCRAFCGESHPDFIYVEGQGARHDILIEQIKEVEKKAVFSPVLSPYKVCLIDGADRMREEASNSLLKLLEEPPTYWLFILVASEISRILPTIRSRLMAIRFEPLHREKAVRVMEELSVPQGETLARLSDGSPGKALHLAEAEAADVAGAGLIHYGRHRRSLSHGQALPVLNGWAIWMWTRHRPFWKCCSSSCAML